MASAAPSDVAATNVSEVFKAAMRRLASTVTIVTAREGERRYGMTATAVTSLCADPPSILFCVNRSASIHPTLSAGARFCVNILGPGHADLSGHFAGKTAPEDRFETGAWAADDFGTPYLADAPANVFCTVDQRLEYGTHAILIGRVYDALSRGAPRPLVYGDGGFLPLAEATA